MGHPSVCVCVSVCVSVCLCVCLCVYLHVCLHTNLRCLRNDRNISFFLFRSEFDLPEFDLASLIALYLHRLENQLAWFLRRDSTRKQQLSAICSFATGPA